MSDLKIRRKLKSTVALKERSAWQFDDLWEEGWQFNEILGNRRFFVPRQFASTLDEALEWAVENWDSADLIKESFIQTLTIGKPKTENSISQSEHVYTCGSPILIIEEKILDVFN